MCTVVLAWRTLSDAPVAVAANRDESFDREARPPRLLDENPGVIAPVDVRAGGTWIGVTEHGLVAAITNRWQRPPPQSSSSDSGESAGAERSSDAAVDSRIRSRGRLVRDALSAPDASTAVDRVETSVDRHAYRGFNLLVVDADRATYLEWDGVDSSSLGSSGPTPNELDPSSDGTAGGLRRRDLAPGVHVVVNPGLNEADARARRLRDELAGSAVDSTATAWLDAAANRLRDHSTGVCVHGDGFGTRSSSLVAVDADGGVRYEFADGPPCTTAFERVACADAVRSDRQ